MIPPTIHDTELKGKKIEKTDWSISSSEMTEAVINGLKNDQYEIAAGTSKNLVSASKSELDQIFKNMNH